MHLCNFQAPLGILQASPGSLAFWLQIFFSVAFTPLCGLTNGIHKIKQLWNILTYFKKRTYNHTYILSKSVSIDLLASTSSYIFYIFQLCFWIASLSSLAAPATETKFPLKVLVGITQKKSLLLFFCKYLTSVPIIFISYHVSYHKHSNKTACDGMRINVNTHRHYVFGSQPTLGTDTYTCASKWMYVH